MSQLPIYNCYHPVLREKSIDIAEFTQEIATLAKDMTETMDKADGAGLAGNQVGRRESIIIIDQQVDEHEPKGHPLVMINPKIITFGDRMVPYKEGCLSIPGYFESVIRPDEIEVVFLDINMKEYKVSLSGRISRVIQHEVDHLNGILFVDRLSSLKKTLSKKDMKKVQRLDFTTFYPMINPDGTFKEADPEDE